MVKPPDLIGEFRQKSPTFNRAQVQDRIDILSMKDLRVLLLEQPEIEVSNQLII